MTDRIIVAGGGHGGIVAAAHLANAGYDVTVYEKNTRENMGWDWTDIFDKKGFTMAGMEMPAPEKYKLKTNMTFYSPNGKVKLTQHTPEDELEIQMERREIYNHIIAYAESCGVKFEYGVNIEGPLMLGNRVVGIKTDKGDQIAALVIDAAGINSPVRRNLPAHLGIQNEVEENAQFYVYRGFYNKTAETEEDKWQLHLLYENILGICWVAAEENYTDVLIGRFEPFDMAEVERTLNSLRKESPALGTELVRGGQFVNIPVRHPLAVLVADGYAAIGDSAFMTVPIIGSGIANSLKAGVILANAVKADINGCYSAATLWKYQRDFYKQYGNGLAPLGAIRVMLTKLEDGDLDYIFENGILNADDMTMGADSNNLKAFMSGFDAVGLKDKALALKGNIPVAKKIIRMGTQIGEAVAATAAMPATYDLDKIKKWAKLYDACFKG